MGAFLQGSQGVHLQGSLAEEHQVHHQVVRLQESLAEGHQERYQGVRLQGNQMGRRGLTKLMMLKKGYTQPGGGPPPLGIIIPGWGPPNPFGGAAKPVGALAPAGGTTTPLPAALAVPGPPVPAATPLALCSYKVITVKGIRYLRWRWAFDGH